jgi:uncharacterized protein YkwD
MYRSFLLLYLILLNSLLSAQNCWQTSDYSIWEYTNFRQNNLFYQPFSSTNPDYLLLDAAVFYLTNEERAELGLSLLRYNKLLEIAAFNHSMRMATIGFFDHTNPLDVTRRGTTDRGKLAGVVNPKISENIAYNFTDGSETYIQVAQKLVKQWMSSPGHRSNILSQNGKQMGIGTFYEKGRIYGTQVFQWYEFVIENAVGGIDQLPVVKCNTINNDTINRIVRTSKQPKSANVPLNENENLNNELARLNVDLVKKEQTILKLTAANNNLNSTIILLNQRKKEKDAQYDKLYSENQILSKQKLKKNITKSKNHEALIFKMGLNSFYPSISNSISSNFNESLFSCGADIFLGANFGESAMRNSIGITLRASQSNRFLTKELNATMLQPIQFYDVELTTILKEWFSFGVGVAYVTSYASLDYIINPSVSIGLCIGPKNWKIQITQQASFLLDKSFFGRASIGLSLIL